MRCLHVRRGRITTSAAAVAPNQFLPGTTARGGKSRLSRRDAIPPPALDVTEEFVPALAFDLPTEEESEWLSSLERRVREHPSDRPTLVESFHKSC
jgi:hypothetical protein